MPLVSRWPSLTDAGAGPSPTPISYLYGKARPIRPERGPHVLALHVPALVLGRVWEPVDESGWNNSAAPGQGLKPSLRFTSPSQNAGLPWAVVRESFLGSPGTCRSQEKNGSGAQEWEVWTLHERRR